MTIDRIDNDGNYEPENCRWVDYDIQENNKSNNREIMVNGTTKTLSEWAKLLHMRPMRLDYAIKHNKEVDWEYAIIMGQVK